jgi:predicted glutamine amidotransferase
MCGIAGFVGQSLHPKATYALMTNLALKTQERGREATGIWGAQGGENGQIIYHKEPINSTEFVQTPEWKKLRSFDPQVLLVHCREPTQSAGSPKTNRNNHPHVSSDYSVALVHNGKVEEYFRLKSKYEKAIKSQCDSEMILRIFEQGEHVPNAEFLKEKYPHLDPENAFRVFGIEEIFKRLDKSAFACAVGERHEGSKRSLWMFRNEKRPLHVVDLRSSMGQIFFFSTMQIWREAVEATHEVKNIIPLDHMVMEFPVHYAFAISFDPTAADEIGEDGNPVEGGWKKGWRIRKYKLTLHREYGEEEEDDLRLPATSHRQARNVQVFTRLNGNDEVQDKASVVSTVATGHEDTVNTPEEAGSTSIVDTDTGDVNPRDVSRSGVSFRVEGEVTSTLTHDDDEDNVRDAEVEWQPEASEESGGKDEDDGDDLPDTEMDTPVGFDMDKLSSHCTEITDAVNEIATEAHNNAMEGNLSPEHFQQILDDLEQLLADTQSIKYHVIRGSNWV